jgi:radical SAM superfamily enzyme YgiQ (UPF0313 family)
VPAAGFGWHARPVGDVVAEVRGLRRRLFAFNDVSLNEDREYALELFRALAPLGKRWGGLATARIGRDDELLDAMARSGCIYLLIGFESLDREALAGMDKGFNRAEDYALLMRKLHDRAIACQGCFIFGMDEDGPDVFDRTVAAVDELRIDIPRYAVYTPYPGTPAFERLKAAGRLLHEHWPHYDTQHVVFRPARMSPEDLDAGFRRAYRRTFSLRSIVHRTSGCRQFPVTLVGNLAYRLYLRRLESERPRVLGADGASPCPA